MKNKPIQAAVNGLSAFRCHGQEEEGILFWGNIGKSGLKPDACMEQKSISRSCLLKTVRSQLILERNFGLAMFLLLIWVLPFPSGMYAVEKYTWGIR